MKIKTILKLLVTYFSLIALLSILLIGAYMIPNRWVANNVIESTKTLENEGIYPTVIRNLYLTRLDNYSDFRMIDIAISGDEKHPVESAFFNYEDYIDGGNMAYGIAELAKGESVEKHVMYSRYWHSYLVYLKPLLIFLDYKEIRFLNVFFLFSSITFLFYSIYKRLNGAIALSLAISMVIFDIFIVPLSMFFMICFMIMIISTLLIIYCPRLIRGSNVYIFFFTIGGVVASMDLLSTPQITFGIPFIIYVITYNPKMPFLKTIGVGLSWLLGYAGIWASKFLVAYLITGRNILYDAIDAVKLRASSTAVGYDFSFGRIFGLVWSFVEENVFLTLFAVIVLVGLFSMAIKYYFSHRKSADVANYYNFLLLVAIIVPVWFILIRNHSFTHLFFTHRAWIVTLFSLLAYLIYTLDFSSFNRRKIV